MKGKLHKSDALFFRRQVGTAKCDGFNFEVSQNVGNGAPIIRCEETGKWFVLPWQEIVQGAIAAGITKPERKKPAKSKQGKAVKP